ncbi:hypothetical protein ACOME3_008004 [Neoechinorhynchus agilis]
MHGDHLLTLVAPFISTVRYWKFRAIDRCISPFFIFSSTCSSLKLHGRSK